MKRGKKYSEAAKLVDSTMLYDAADAIDLVQKTSTTKFDATVEAHFVWVLTADMLISRFVVP